MEFGRAVELAFGLALMALMGGIGVALFWLGMNYGAFVWEYRITSTHLELFLFGRWPVRRVPLGEVFAVGITDRGDGLACVAFNVRLFATGSIRAIFGRFESWQKSWCGPSVVVEAGDRQILLTPDDPSAFARELRAAARRVRGR